jgi:chromosome condensin MukBEF MukE localization factor
MPRTAFSVLPALASDLRAAALLGRDSDIENFAFLLT